MVITHLVTPGLTLVLILEVLMNESRTRGVSLGFHQLGGEERRPRLTHSPQYY